ncbi:T9SS type A sorting domain-containing protein [Segetibacter sp. 3557_3]|uniref:LamG-like jellyroll fold domain-containing protein n=1 Tax=Segetibacter sp. 3557_3 TaxID=2547429 RepID=UPI001058C0DF|nr:LamG-like jellyroll fold domain-containing protein [Segetibacter sp. 3557_3]TDH24263.1 T9SS type A sorting domain-containing protein [Segetibacter sp. 3557_3]
MKKIYPAFVLSLLSFITSSTSAQTLAFPGADGFGRFAKGARAVTNREVYIVTNINDAGPGSFRDAVSKPGRIVVFAVGGNIKLLSDVVVTANVTIAGQTAPGDGIVLSGKRVTFSGASNTISRYLRVRLGATDNAGKDASGLSNGNNMIFDHMSFSWGMDEVFSINWDNKGSSPDSITIQNSMIAQGLHRDNHSAGGLIQTPDGGKISLLRNLYISNKTRNPKVKGVNEFVNNVVYNWGNGNRLGPTLNYGWSGDAYIMGGSSGVSEVNVINNYFMSGPLTPPTVKTPFSRGTGTFNIFASGNYFDKNINGVLDGSLVPYDSTGYPGITGNAFKMQPFPYPAANPLLTAEQAYQLVADSAGASYPKRDQVDSLLAAEVRSHGTQGYYVYRETDLPFTNGGVGNVFNAPAPLDTDSDGMPDAWEDANGLNKNNKADATLFSTGYPEYLNIEVYINGLINTTPPPFILPPTNVLLGATSFETPSPYSKVTINWSDNANNEEYYVLERSEDSVVFSDIAHPVANTSSYLDSGLVPNKTYYYRLKAVQGAISSSYSSILSVKTPPLPSAPVAPGTPNPVNGNKYVELAGGKLTLRWTGSNNTTSYQVYLGSSATLLTKLADVPYAAAPSYQLSGLADSTTYYWRVDASNAKGTATGTVWNFRTTPLFQPGLIGHWSFDEADGIQVIDSSDYQAHGILGLDDDDTTTRITGRLKNALDFANADPSKYVVSIPSQDHLFIDRGSFSLAFWMKATPSHLPQDNNTSAYLLCKGSISRSALTGATGKRFDIEFKNKQLRFAVDDDNDAGGGGKDELQTNGAPFFTNSWVHVALVRDTLARKLRAYLNGVMVGETNNTRAKSIGEASALAIGNIGELEFLANTNAPAPYKGMLDELRLYNYTLTLAEIQQLAQVGSGALPMKLVAFAATKNGTAVLVSWQTASEVQGGKYIVERSADGANWMSIATITASGRSANNYGYTDKQPLDRSNFYRIRLVSADGSYSFTPVRLVSFSRQTELTLYPNPSTSVSMISFNLASSKGELTITDAAGKTILKQTLTSESGPVNVQTSTLVAGTYIVKLKTAETTLVKKLVVMR